MKKTISFFTLFMFFSVCLSAQYAINWMNDAGNYNKTAVMGTADNQDNLIVTGYWQSYNMFTRKISPQGSLLWEAEDASGISGLYEKPYWINCDSNDNIYVVGKRYSISSEWEYPDAIIALKYSSVGVLLWKQLIPVSLLIGSQHPGFNVRSEVDADGNLYIGSFAANPSGVILAKIDAVGNLVYVKTNTVNEPRGFSSMRLHGNSIVLATGSYTTELAPVYVWNTDGTLQWTATAIGKGTFDIEIDDLSNIYTISYLTNAVSSTSGDDITISKFSSEGNQLWKKDYDLGGAEFPARFVYCNNRLSAISYGSSSPGAYFDWKTFQIDTSGTLLWSALYDGTSANDELPYFITAKPTGEVIVTGKAGPSPDPNNLSYLQMVILQYSNTGQQNWLDTPNIYGGWGITSIITSDSSMYAISSSNMSAYHYLPDQSTGIIKYETKQNIQAFPNPVNDKFTLIVDGVDEQSVVFVYNNLGKLLMSYKLTQEQTDFDLSEISSGMYFFRIIGKNCNQTIKIIKK